MNKIYCEWPNLPKNIIVALAELKAKRATIETTENQQKKEHKNGQSRTRR